MAFIFGETFIGTLLSNSSIFFVLSDLYKFLYNSIYKKHAFGDKKIKNSNARLRPYEY